MLKWSIFSLTDAEEQGTYKIKFSETNQFFLVRVDNHGHLISEIELEGNDEPGMILNGLQSMPGVIGEPCGSSLTQALDLLLRVKERCVSNMSEMRERARREAIEEDPVLSKLSYFERGNDVLPVMQGWDDLLARQEETCLKIAQSGPRTMNDAVISESIHLLFSKMVKMFEGREFPGENPQENIEEVSDFAYAIRGFSTYVGFSGFEIGYSEAMKKIQSEIDAGRITIGQPTKDAEAELETRLRLVESELRSFETTMKHSYSFKQSHLFESASRIFFLECKKYNSKRPITWLTALEKSNEQRNLLSKEEFDHQGVTLEQNFRTWRSRNPDILKDIQKECDKM